MNLSSILSQYVAPNLVALGCSVIGWKNNDKKNLTVAIAASAVAMWGNELLTPKSNYTIILASAFLTTAFLSSKIQQYRAEKRPLDFRIAVLASAQLVGTGFLLRNLSTNFTSIYFK